MSPNRMTLAVCIAAALLAGCSSGSSRLSVSAPAAPPTSPPPPPPPPPTPGGQPCPSPVTADCALQGQYTLTFDEYGMDGGRQSDYRLLVHGGTTGGGFVNLRAGEYRFGGGTEIAGTTLVVWDTLASNVAILRDQTGLGFAGKSELWLLGTVRGNVVNDELLNLRCYSGIHACASVPQQRIEGNYTQAGTGLLEVTMGRHLQVTGKASLAGLVRLVGGGNGYVLPTAPGSVLLLHADGGIEGNFYDWRSQGLFVEGALRHTPNDVFFDATRLSVQAAMAASSFGQPLVVASAGNLDRALAGADDLVRRSPPSLDIDQQRFLASASSLLWMQDGAQAALALESLAGHAHASIRDRLHVQVVDASSRLDARLSELAWSAGPLAWSEPFGRTLGAQAIDGMAGGVDQWLSPRLLVGAGIGSGRSTLYFDHMGGQAHGESPMASLHAHYRGDGWHATGQAGAGRATIRLQRPIGTGSPGTHSAYSQRVLDHAFAHGEIGRDLAVAGGRLVPFAAVDYLELRSDGFAEQGDSGFELLGAPADGRQLAASIGARYARDWRTGSSALRLDLDARHRRTLLEGGPPRAAFRRVPDVWFTVPDPSPQGFTEVGLRLGGTMGTRWNWSVGYARSFGHALYDDYELGLRRDF